MKSDVRYQYQCPKCFGIKLYKVQSAYLRVLQNHSLCQDCKQQAWLENAINNHGFNRKACAMMDEWNKQGYHFQHALNGGECMIPIAGYYYFLDGYDKEHGIIFEYDEPYHETPEQKQKDIERQDYIFSYCYRINLPIAFFRYSELRKQLYSVHPSPDCFEILPTIIIQEPQSTASQEFDAWIQEEKSNMLRECYCYH